jgi:hypothetical protein
MPIFLSILSHVMRLKSRITRGNSATVLQLEKAAKVVNIAGINRSAFLLNIRYKGNTIFIISLYKINRILKSRKEDEEDIS